MNYEYDRTYIAMRNFSAGNISEIVKGLPQDLRKMTRKQQTDAVNVLAKKSLRELRRMQEIIKKQIPKAHGRVNDRGLSNLQIMETLLTRAVDKREFGD